MSAAGIALRSDSFKSTLAATTVEGGAPATEVMTEQQLEVLGAFVPRLPEAPTVKQALLAVAKLGGHLKSNGEPGWLVLGRGYQMLLSYEAGWSAARRRHRNARRGWEM